MDTPSDIDRLALQIYNDHRQAIDLIIKSKPSNMLWYIIEPVVERYAPDFKNHSSDKIRLYFTSPRLDFHINENKPEPMFRFDFLYHEGSLRLRLIVARDPETRNRLFEMDPPTDYDHRGQNPDEEDFRMYWKEILSRHECNPSDPDMKPRLEKAIQEFYENDYLPLVNAIRKEFNRPPVSPNLTRISPKPSFPSHYINPSILCYNPYMSRTTVLEYINMNLSTRIPPT